MACDSVFLGMGIIGFIFICISYILGRLHGNRETIILKKIALEFENHLKQLKKAKQNNKINKGNKQNISQSKHKAKGRI